MEHGGTLHSPSKETEKGNVPESEDRRSIGILSDVALEKISCWILKQ